MWTKDVLLDELNREAERTKRALQAVATDRYDWKPHETSMAFGYLVSMVATVPSWIAMVINRDELDVKPKDGSAFQAPPMQTTAQLLAALDGSVGQARSALQGTSDDFLKTTWRLLETGATVAEDPRGVVIADTLNHWVHHRGQLTVYLRLMGAKVPALYGPSADDHRFR